MIPLFIGGCPRSGTTILQEILNSNEYVYISSEENIVNLKKHLSKYLGTRERRSEIAKGRMRDHSMRENITIEMMLSHTFTAESVLPILVEVYKCHHKLLHNHSSLKIWGDKLPNYYKNISELLSIDGAYYIHITRNPIDVVNSMLRRTEMAKHGRDWWRAVTNLSDMIEAWSVAYDNICKFESHPNVLHLYYEDFVFNIENEIKRINDFLRVDFAYKYSNVLINDLSKHFDRNFIDSNISALVKENVSVVRYQTHVKNAFSMESPVYYSLFDL